MRRSLPYTGRFAPSPTGELHLGTLAAAVASFLHARQADGRWLVRIEDIDPPREVPGSADRILRTLEALELHWDGSVRYQSTRIDEYLAVADSLLARGLAFRCRCSRREIRAAEGSVRYPGTCRQLDLPDGDVALRLRVDDAVIRLWDGLRGGLQRDIALTDGDFVIVRRDGLPAYHLAVVVDDADQGITDIVRGADLLESTLQHIYLQRCLDVPSPAYWHIPLLTNRAGEKLSKSAGSAAIDPREPAAAARRALQLLGLPIPAELAAAPPHELWAYAAGNFSFAGLGKGTASLPIDD